MSTTNTISMTVDLSMEMADAERRVRAELTTEGFGVLTEIDVQQTLRSKLEVTIPAYRILGACNPALAYRAITAVPEVGALLPCNVVLREVDTATTRVEVADPLMMLQLIDDVVLREVAAAARERLGRVVDALRATSEG